MAGLGATQWIARCAAEIIKTGRRTSRSCICRIWITIRNVWARIGATGPKLVGELDAACAPLLDAARNAGARIWVTNEYTHLQVDQPVLINRALRSGGLTDSSAGTLR